MFTWLSCKRYSQRSSRKLDGQLSLVELPGYWFHHVICYTCRRMTRHFGFIDSVSQCLGDCMEEELSAPGGDTLSPEKSRQIQAMLEKQNSTE